MKKHTTFALSLGLLVLGLLLVARVAHADFLLWLDGPSQKSGAHIAALTKTAEAKSGAHTSTPTFSQTPTASFSATFTPGSAGNTFTMTVTPTSTTGTGGSGTPGPVLYNDATAAAGIFTSACPGQSPLPGWNAGTAGGGAPGDTGSYLNLTVAATVGTAASTCYSVAGNINYGYSATGVANVYNASGQQSLSFWFRVPASNGNCFNPGVRLVSIDGTGTQTLSVPVTVTAYIQPQATFPMAGTWYNAIVPLSAFLGPNLEGGTFTNTMLTTIAGATFQPYFGMYDANGNYTGSIDIDNVQFGGTSETAVTRTGLFSSFENGDASSCWGTYWSANIDAITCTSPYTSLVYPTGTGKILDVGGNTMGTACHAGHIAGYLTLANGDYGPGGATDGSGVCKTANNDYGYLNTTCNLDANSTATLAISHPLNNNSYVQSLPVTGAKGMRFWLKRGPTGDASYVIKVFIDFTDSTGSMNASATVANNGNEYYVLINSADIPTTNFAKFEIPFPNAGVADPLIGAYPPPTAVQSYPGAGLTLHHYDVGGGVLTTPPTPATVHNGASGLSELWWGEPWYAGQCVPFSLAYVYDVGVGAIVRGSNIDVYIDDIEFY